MILGLLSERPLHGYELKSAYEAELVPGTQLNFGQVYTTLDRLRRDGLVRDEVVTQSPRPTKKVHALTDAGRRELDEWLTKVEPPRLELRNETFLKLALARRLGADPVAILDRERKKALARLHDVERVQLSGEPLAGLLLDLASRQLAAYLAWLDHCEEHLRSAGTRRKDSR